MTDPRRSTPNEATILRAWARLLKSEIRVGIIGEITEYDSTTRLATVQAVMQGQDGEVVPPLRDVRVGTLRAGPFVVSMPVAVGDAVLVHLLDYSHDAYIASGRAGTTPDARRRHDLSDAVCVPLALSPEVIANASASDLVIGRDNGTGTVSVSPSGDVTVAGSKVVADSPDIRLGSVSASDPVVLASELNAWCLAIEAAIIGLGGAATGLLPIVGASKAKAE